MESVAVAQSTADQGPRAVAVGLGEARVADLGSGECLVAYGLGSCVAMCLFDPTTRVAGLAHVLLPGADPNGAPNAKFAQSALPLLVALMTQRGARPDPRRYVARLAGGATVLAIGGGGSLPRVGPQNADSVRAALAATGIRIEAEDLGGTRGRTIWFDPRDGGRIRIRTVGSEERFL
jgi:chemotaxis protein CheD